jgi:hypothetical protein
MKKAIICVLLTFFIIRIGVGTDKKTPSSEELRGQLNPEQALERAKVLWKSEAGKVEQTWEKIMHEKVRAEYDSIWGPYFVLSQVVNLNSSYLLFFVKSDGAIVGQALVDAHGEKSNDKIWIFPKAEGPDYKTFILDSCSVEQKFYQSFQKEVVFSQMVFPARFWGPSFITHLPAVWWLIDQDGYCYFMTFSGDIYRFSKLLEMKSKRKEGMRIITNQDLVNPGDSSNIHEGGLKK